MDLKLKKLIDKLDENSTLELVEYASDRLKTFNNRNSEPSIDFSRDPQELLKTFMDAISGLSSTVVENPDIKK